MIVLARQEKKQVNYMSDKKVYTIGVVSLGIFIILAAILWYLYFNNYERKLLSQNESAEFSRGVELVNSGEINYLDATNKDDDSIVPIYYFRVKNNTNKDYDYVLYFENATSNDGCTPSSTFSRDDLEYELKLDNKVIKKGGLDTLQNNVLDINTITSKGVNDYSLKVRLKESVTDYSDKHFHYIVTMKEKK